jgi:hypothetical protein
MTYLKDRGAVLGRDRESRDSGDREQRSAETSCRQGRGGPRPRTPAIGGDPTPPLASRVDSTEPESYEILPQARPPLLPPPSRGCLAPAKGCDHGMTASTGLSALVRALETMEEELAIRLIPQERSVMLLQVSKTTRTAMQRVSPPAMIKVI